MSLPYSTITPIPNNEPDAVPGLWNTRYTEIDANFDALDERQISVETEVAQARQGRDSLGAMIGQIINQIGGIEVEQAGTASAATLSRAYLLEQAYNDAGFDFELFGVANPFSFRDMTPVAVAFVTAGDDTLDLVSTSTLREGYTYILSDAQGRFAEAFEVDRILTATRLRAKASFTHSFGANDGVAVGRSTFRILDGYASVRHLDRLYSRVLRALRFRDQGRLVIRRSATGTGAFAVKVRALGTDAWADALWLGTESLAVNTRDESYEIGIGGDIELLIQYVGINAGDTDTVQHMALYAPPRADLLSLVKQPVNTSPTDQAAGVGETPVLQGSPFYSIYGVSQSGAQFQVARDRSFSDLVLNTSTDFLASWIGVSQVATVQTLNAAVMSGDGIGLAVGNSAALITTDDSGATWTAKSFGGSAHLYAAAQSSTARLVGGATGTLKRSTYNGAEWSAWSALTPAAGYTGAIRGVAVVGANILFVGTSGAIQTSNDGGTFFVARTAAASYTGQFNAVAMDGVGNAIAVGASGAIQTSNNFGVSWTARAADNSYSGAFTAVAMNEAGDAIAVGATGEIQTSSDYGATWTRRTTADAGAFTGDFSAVTLTADGAAVAVGATGEIQTSSDYGATWYARDASAAFAGVFRGVDIDANGDAVIVGDNGTIQRANRLESATTSYTVPSGDDMLATGNVYWWRCRYQDADSAWSPWSTPTAFMTASVFAYAAQPSAIAPAASAVNVSPSPVLQSSPFAYVGGSATHSKTQWQIAAASDFLVTAYNSGESDDLTAHPVPVASQLDLATAYYWRCRHKSSAGDWSAWSVPVRFTVAESLGTKIGIAGTQGFGVGPCPDDAIPAGFAALSGATDVASINYGNYQTTNGSIMCFVPRFYYRIGSASSPRQAMYGANAIDVAGIDTYATEAAANAAGFAMHRAFLDDGQTLPGFFIDKYLASKDGSASCKSIANADPISLTTTAGYNPSSGMTGCTGILADAVVLGRARGAGFYCASIFQYSALALLSLAHAQAATSTTHCAWYDASGVTNFPKGCNNGSLSDVNDSSVTYAASYSTKPKTRATANFAKTTHNGQECGVADLNGSLWQVMIGLTSPGTSGTDSAQIASGHAYVLKTSVALADLTGGWNGTHDAWGDASNLATKYDLVSGLMPWGANTGAVCFGNGANQVFDGAIGGAGWQRTGSGIQMNTASVSGSGTNQFGNDYCYQYNKANMCPLVSGRWVYGAFAGVFCRSWSHDRLNDFGGLGFRCGFSAFGS